MIAKTALILAGAVLLAAGSLGQSARAGETPEKPSVKKSAPWSAYHNPRFGFDLPVPPGLKAQRDPDNGGGRTYVSADGAFSLSAWGAFNVDEAITGLDAQWKEELAREGRTVTYKKKGDVWFVVSGETKDGREFYEKRFVKGDHCAGFSITYPKARLAEFQAWVERVEKEFKANLGQGIDRIEKEPPTKSVGK